VCWRVSHNRWLRVALIQLVAIISCFAAPAVRPLITRHFILRASQIQSIRRHRAVIRVVPIFFSLALPPLIRNVKLPGEFVLLAGRQMRRSLECTTFN
jgi:hypothetical protein